MRPLQLLYLFPLWSLMVALPAARATTFDITDYGAVADDGTDDRAAIQATLDDACAEVALGTPDVAVYVPPGVFDIAKGSEPAPTEPWVILRLGCGGFTLHGEPATVDTAAEGSASILRLADAQGAFESLLGTPQFATDLDDFTLRDLTLDGNGAANPILGGDADVDDVLREHRFALRVYSGRGLQVERARFTGWRNLNVISANGVDVADVTIRDSVFDAIGQPSALAPDWDHSAIYTDCDGARIENNVFTSVGPGSFGVRTAIEIHGPDQIVRGNRIEDFTTGINVTGVSALGSPRQAIEDNAFLRVADGIRIWAFEVDGNPPGEPVLEDVIIRNNTVEIAIDTWRVTQDAFEQPNVGISLVGDSDGVIEQLRLVQNRITFTDFGAKPRDYDSGSAGIRLAPFINTELPIRGLEIRDNTIAQAPATAIYLGSPLPDGAQIVNNRIVDAGLSPTVSDGLRTGILIFGRYADVDVRRTCVVDTDPVAPRLAQAFYLFDQSDGGNSIAETGIETAAGSIDFVRNEADQGVPWQIEDFSQVCDDLFRSGFESGDTAAWSAAVP